MSCKDVSTVREQVLMTAVAQQPVSTAIKADQCSFQVYTSDVLSALCGGLSSLKEMMSPRGGLRNDTP